jgi:hypothetical protein
MAVVDDKTFARFDGYTSENNYCSPFTIFVSRAYTYQQPVVIVAQEYNQASPHPEVVNPSPIIVASDVTWSIGMDGKLTIRKGSKGPSVILRLNTPKIYTGSVSKP